MLQLITIILVVSLYCELLQAMPRGYSDSLSVNRYYSGSFEKNQPNNYVTGNVKTPEKADTRIRRDVNGVSATATTRPESATIDGTRILFTDAPVADRRNAGSERSRTAGGRRKYGGWDGTTTRRDDRSSFARPTAPYGQQLTTEYGCSSTCEVTFPWRKSTSNYYCKRFGGRTTATGRGSRRKYYGAGSAATADLQRAGAEVVAATNTDTATALGNPEKRHRLKKLRHASAFPGTGGTKRLSVSRGTVVPKRLHMTEATNVLRRLSSKPGSQMKRSRRFGKLNVSPVAKSPDGGRLSIVTWVSVHHPVVGYNRGEPFGELLDVPWHPYLFLSY